MSDVIPRDLALFIAERISTVSELEGLLLLRQYSQSKWGSRDVAQRLYIGEKDAEEVLKLLCANGLVHKEGDESSPVYYYRPDSEDLNATVERLASIYA